MRPAPLAARPLERALLFTLFAHGLAMLGMALLLLPGMPGGPHAAIADRAAYVAAHPWLWRAGWFGWQLTAASDLLLAIALVVTPWVPRLPAILTLLVTLITLVPDQYGQATWTWVGTRLAAHPADYAPFETHAMRLIAGWGTVGYLTAALGWTWCFAAAGTWSRQLTRLSIATWGLFAIATVGLFVPHAPAWLPILTSAGNAVSFVLLMVWLAAVTERVLRRSRPTVTVGHWAPWKHPAGWCAVNAIANSRLARAIGERLPFLTLISDMTDVVYVSYLVRAEQLEPLVPPGLALQRLGGNALFTILIFRHGHFGPRLLGPLRRLCPSPIQSNWRIYVTDPTTGQPGVHFVTTAIHATLGALIARATSENVPMHVPAFAALTRTGDHLSIQLDPGTGTAPDLSAELLPATDALPDGWTDGFASHADAMAYIVPQDRAFAPQPWYGRTVRQEIRLGISLSDCRPLSGTVRSQAARALIGEAEPLCFIVDRVRFTYLGSHPNASHALAGHATL